MKTYQECDISINILGTEYVLHICPESKDERFGNFGCTGFCDHSTKELFVSNFIEFKNKDISVSDIRYVIRTSIKHEMVHAFMYESGLGEDWEHKDVGQEETVVDWIARQLDKMNTAADKVMEELKQYEVEL